MMQLHELIELNASIPREVITNERVECAPDRIKSKHEDGLDLPQNASGRHLFCQGTDYPNFDQN